MPAVTESQLRLGCSKHSFLNAYVQFNIPANYVLRHQTFPSQCTRCPTELQMAVDDTRQQHSHDSERDGPNQCQGSTHAK